MTNPYYAAGPLVAHSLVRSSVLKAEFNAIESAFDSVYGSVGGGTSATSLTIGLGSKTFILAAGTFAIGQFILIVSTLSPSNLMFGQVTARNTTTNQYTVNVIYTTGAGTFAAWTISLSPPGTVAFTATSADTLQNKTLDLTTTTFSGAATGVFVGATPAAGAAGYASFRLPHGAAPTTNLTDGDLWSTTAGVFARVNGATVGPFLSAAGGTLTGALVTVASATGGAGVRVPHGTAPTTPVNGDFWSTTAGFFGRVNGATVQFAGLTANTFTGKQTLAASTTAAASLNIPAGTAPTTPSNGDVWVTTTDVLARLNGVSETLAKLSGGTFTGKVTTVASATGSAGLNLPHGAAPTTPANGDLWTTTAGLLAQINGATQTMLTSAGGTLTGKLTTVASATGGAGLNVPAGTAPTTPVNGDFWTTSTLAQIRLNGTTQTLATLAGGTFTGPIITPASATGAAGLNVPHGTAPTTPANGDLWSTTAGFFGRVNSTTVQFAGLGANTFAGKQVLPASATGGAPFNIPAGTAPTTPTNGDIWTTTTLVQARLNGVTQTLATLAGGTFTGGITTVASTTGGAGLNVPHGAAPTTPVNGDFWSTTAGFYGRVNGVSVQFATGTVIPQSDNGSSVTLGTSASVGISTNSLAVGLSAVAGNGSGNSCTALGYGTNAGNGNSTAVGAGATSAANSTAVGYLADAPGNSDTCIGSTAGSSLTTGNNNTVVGRYAGAAAMASNVVLADGAGVRKFWHDNTDAFVLHATTASAANAYLDSATNKLQRSTSSLRYKTGVEDLWDGEAQKLLGLRPVFYRSKCAGDRDEWSHYGVIAEEADKLGLQRLVAYTYLPEDLDRDEADNPVPKPGAKMVPDGFAYDRMTVLLLKLVQDQHAQIAAMEARIAALEGAA